MDLKIALRYAVLICLLTLLWLSLEYMVGLHDVYAAYHPYVTLFSLLIPAYCIRKAIKDVQEDEPRPVTFRHAFFIGLFTILFTAVLMVPVQIVFHQFINPDFFQNMIDYAAKHAAIMGDDPEKARLQAQSYFNLTSYIIQTVLGTLLFGTIISVVVGWWMTRRR